MTSRLRGHSPRASFLSALLTFLLSPGFVLAADCNTNQIEDARDLTDGASIDCNDNGIPDECETVPVSFGVTASPLSLDRHPLVVLTGDMDADGFVDVVVGSERRRDVLPKLYVLQGSGNINLLAPVGFDAAEGLDDLILGDLDSDGDLDVATVDSTSVVRVFKNDGNAGLSLSGEFPTTPFSLAVYTTDIDGDGAEDLVTVSPANDSLSWFINRGEAIFEESQVVATGDRPVAVATGDFDGNGHVELAVATATDRQVDVLSHPGDGQFSLSASLPTGPLTRDIATAELNGDGFPELVTAGLDALRVWHGQATGQFEAPVVYPGAVSELKFGDVDDDGLEDVVAANDSLGVSFKVFLNTRSEALSPAQTFAADLVSFAVEDLDHDGDADLVLAGADPAHVVVLEKGGERALVLERSEFSVSHRPHSIATGDFNGDRIVDVVTGNANDATYSILLGQGAGTFQPVLVRSVTDPKAVAVAVADLDSDGADDVVYRGGGAGGGRVCVLLNEDADSFSEPACYLSPSGGRILVLTDIDVDGHVDLLTAGSNRLGIHFNDGKGDLGFRRDFPIGLFPTGVTVGDLDGDGRSDVVTSNFTSSDISVLLAEGGRNFATAMTIPVEGGPQGVVAIDADSDGDLDLAVANQGSQDVAVLLNNGGASFGSIRRFPLDRVPQALLTVDLNGDHLADLVTTNERSNSISILRGTGGGAFSTVEQFGVGLGPRLSTSDDVDDDGDQDLLVANRAGRSVSVILNQQASAARDVDFLPLICTPVDLERVSVPGVEATVQRRTSYLLPSRPDPGLLSPLFRNVGAFPHAQDFLVEVFPERFESLNAAGYTALVGRRQSRDYFTGSITRLRTEAGVVFGFDVFTEPAPGELLTVEETRLALDGLAAIFQLRPLVYVPTTPEAKEIASNWAAPGFPVLLLEDPAPEPEPPRATPVFELEVPLETTVCGVFSVAGADRGPSHEHLFKSTVALRAGTISLPTAEDLFEEELFERVTFGPAGDEVQPAAPGSFRVRRIPAVDDVTTYQFTYTQEFLLPDQRTLQVAIVSPLQYRALGEEPLERTQPLPEAFFVALKGREALQGNIDDVPSLRFGSCGYDSLTRWDVEFQLADGNSFRLREHYDEAESEFDTAPATLRAANVVLGEESRKVEDYFDLVYSAFRHNTKITYWIILDPPVRLGVRRLGGVELKAPGLPDRPEPKATYLDTRLEPLEVVAVSNFRREPVTQVAFRRGDADADGQLTVLDAQRVLDLLFGQSMPLVCAQAADANDDGKISIVDAIVAIGALFGRDPLPSPFPACGTDSTQPALSCNSYNPCG